MKYTRGKRRTAALAVAILTVSLLTSGCASGDTGKNISESTPTNIAAPTTSLPTSAPTPEATPEVTKAAVIPEWSAEELMLADFMLYRVDCASQSKDSFPEGIVAGLCQTVSDMPYGEDPGTHLTWGYRPERSVISAPDSLGEGLTAYKWVIDRESEDIAKAEIRYDFTVPVGTYTVTLGFYNPFGVRKIDVDCEDTHCVSGEKILRYLENEKTFDVEVTDGELNLRVYNADAMNFMDTPILSYINIAIEPEYTRDLLEAAVSAMTVENAGEIYTTASAEAYLDSLEKAKSFLNGDNSGENAIKLRFNNLRESFKMLTEKNKYSSFRPGAVWTDTENTPIQAHGGQVQQLEIPDPETGKTVTKWVWVGEDKTHGYRGGVCAYTSDDLYNWQFEGIIMRNVPSRHSLEAEVYFKELYKDYTSEQLDSVALALDAERAVIERPKLIYNEKNKQYVLWFHADGPTATSDSNYAAACAGVAVSDTPFGPYRFVGRYRLNTCPPDQEDKHPQSKGMARDMNLFKDTDGTAYIIYSSEENLTLYISKLNDDYTFLSTPPETAVYGEDFIRLFPGAQREAPALFLKDGKYYLMTSGCTGWAPNQARYYVSDSVMGEWVSKGDPCVGDDNRTTFESQSTCIFRDVNSGTWIYMGDRWFADTLNDSRYVWLPIVFKENGDMEISFVNEWTLQ
ncbi:MAG: family 43 glycosylhydrolase [Lachnospiraceae bacterium]|nr:family 43 glycosylhydrolase [Lachnospiraceae bacterium]